MAIATKQLNIRLEPELADAVRAEAVRSRRTIAAVVTLALERYFEAGEAADRGKGKHEHRPGTTTHRT